MRTWQAMTAAAVACAASRWATPRLARVLGGAGLMRPRRRDGRSVATGVGLAPLAAAVAAGAAADSDERAVGRLYLPALVAALAGLVDDVASQGPRGWRAHWKALLEGRPSTGILKAALTGLAAMAAAAGGSRRRGAARSFLTGASSVLAANALNQLDTAPGQAALGFFAGFAAVGLMSEGPRRARWMAGLPLAGAVLGYLPYDRRGDVMLGDSGANALGAALGWIAGESLPLRALVAWTAGLLVVNALFDRWSLSRWVEVRARARPRMATRRRAVSRQVPADGSARQGALSSGAKLGLPGWPGTSRRPSGPS